jgi:hypothetical protein
MAAKSGKAWKLTRATVHRKDGGAAPKSNKYSKHDTDHNRKPQVGERARSWVGGYTRADGRHVSGHYRVLKRAA